MGGGEEGAGLNIVFMGTPDFAVPALTALHGSRHRVRLVVTQPDRPSGRGRKPTPPAVKKAALEMGYPVIQPESTRTAEFTGQLKKSDPDLFVVVAFGHILRKNVLSIPPLGTINIHASLLPRYRGPAPIQRAIIDRVPETGVTTMMLDEGMDTGDILLKQRTAIGPAETAGTLHDRLSRMGADLLLETLDGLQEGSVSPRPQDPDAGSYAPMLTKEEGHIDWTADAESIEARIRGMTPWPGAFTFHGEQRLKIFRAERVDRDEDVTPGTVVPGFPDELRVAAGKDALSILEIQGASGKRMEIASFLRGYDLPAGSRLE